MFRYVVLLIFISSIGSAPNANSQTLVTQEDECLGVDPIPYYDGRYSFNRESWRRFRANRHYYGRCIEVTPPTEELKNTWDGVLPPGSIARVGRPTIAGQEFTEEMTRDAVADLYYGNSDDKFAASYLAHEFELAAASNMDSSTPSLIGEVGRALNAFGQLVTESIFQTSFLIDSSNDESIADLNLHFRSTIEGSSTQYLVSYALDVQSEEYRNRTLALRFGDPFLSDLVLASSDSERFELELGGADFEFNWLDTVNPGFARSSADVVDEDGQVLVRLSISYYKTSP